MATATATSPTTNETSPTKLFSFPNPVNEVSARLVAGGVVFLATVIAVTGWKWLLLPLAYGFIARVATGPRLSPLGLFVTRVATPRLPFDEKLVAGPPKRFAQAMGVAFSTTAAVLWLGFDNRVAATVVLVMLIFAASLESFVGYCLGCKIFGLLMKAGIISEEVCDACNNIEAYRAKLAAQHA